MYNTANINTLVLALFRHASVLMPKVVSTLIFGNPRTHRAVNTKRKARKAVNNKRKAVNNTRKVVNNTRKVVNNQ
jgi:hypothetical protein